MRLRGIFCIALFAVLLMGACPNVALPAESVRLEQLHKQRSISCEQCHGGKSQEPVPMETCLTCHGSYEKLADLSKRKSPNPHDSHLGEIRCTLCHHVHKDSALYCNTCHAFDLKVP
jgi:hypothetical protein